MSGPRSRRFSSLGPRARAGRRAARALAVALLIVAGLPGCLGSGDDGDRARTTTAPSSAARERFVARLDALCRRADAIRADGDAKLARAQSSAESSREAARAIVKIVGGMLPRVQRLEDELRRVDPPPGEARFASEYLAYTEEINNLLAVSREAARRYDVRTFQSIGDRSNAVAARRAALVKRHGGFRRCSDEAG